MSSRTICTQIQIYRPHQILFSTGDSLAMADLASSRMKPALCTLCVFVTSCSVQPTEARREQNFVKLSYCVHKVRAGANATIVAAAGLIGLDRRLHGDRRHHVVAWHRGRHHVHHRGKKPRRSPSAALSPRRPRTTRPSCWAAPGTSVRRPRLRPGHRRVPPRACHSSLVQHQVGGLSLEVLNSSLPTYRPRPRILCMHTPVRIRVTWIRLYITLQAILCCDLVSSSITNCELAGADGTGH